MGGAMTNLFPRGFFIFKISFQFCFMRPPLKFHFQLAHCLVHQLLEPSRQFEKHPQRVLFITAFNQLLIYAYAKQKGNLPKQPFF